MNSSKRSKLLVESEIDRLDSIKRAVLTALFADDELMEVFVLKGGSALDLVHHVTARASIDIDLSIPGDLPFPLDEVLEKVARNLARAFDPLDYHVFDVTMDGVPPNISPDFVGFWGGYKIHFKLIGKVKMAELKGDLVSMRRNALLIGQKGKFKIDISKFEYCRTKAPTEIDGFRIYVYTPEMIVAEKLRSLCQQTTEYAGLVRSHRTQRSRDLVDIHAVVDGFRIDMREQGNLDLVGAVFEAKRVSLALLGKLEGEREFHRSDFPSVVDTMRASTELQSYDFYFDFMLNLVGGLKSLWNE